MVVRGHVDTGELSSIASALNCWLILLAPKLIYPLRKTIQQSNHRQGFWWQRDDSRKTKPEGTRRRCHWHKGAILAHCIKMVLKACKRIGCVRHVWIKSSTTVCQGFKSPLYSRSHESAEQKLGLILRNVYYPGEERRSGLLSTRSLSLWILHLPLMTLTGHCFEKLENHLSNSQHTFSSLLSIA